MEENYFDPNRFRLNLNSFIQEARNVTFILQKKKGDLPGFESWYSSWQERLKADPILRWIVESRNRITKQGDLEIRSECNAVFQTDWTDERTKRFKANPSVPSLILAKQALSQIPVEHRLEESLISIERKWIDNSLPTTELLQATGHALRVLSELIYDAHVSLIEKAFPDFKCPHVSRLADSRSKYSIELANAEDLRTVWMTATDLKFSNYALRENTLEAGDFAEVKAKYGEMQEELKTIGDISELKNAVKMIQLGAKRILTKDGFHQTYVFAFNAERNRFPVIRLQMENRAGKHIAIRRVASLLKQDSFNWVALVGECWVASFDHKPPYRHASEFPDKQEALMINAVNSEGKFMNSQAIFRRCEGSITLDDWIDDEHPANIMLPLLNAIRR